jgi:nicotinamide mononucleotide transporter
MNFFWFVDKIAVIFSFAGIYFNARKHMGCWPIWMISNLLWVVYALHTRQATQVLLWAVFFVCNILGWRKWRKDAAAKATA